MTPVFIWHHEIESVRQMSGAELECVYTELILISSARQEKGRQTHYSILLRSCQVEE